MAFDRYTSCVDPLKYKIVITSMFAKGLIILQWLFLIGGVILIFFFEKTLFYPSKALGIFVVLTSVIMYAKAAITLKKESRYLRNIMDQPSSVIQNQEVRLLNEKRFLTTMFMVSYISVSTLCPMVIYDVIHGRLYYTMYENAGLVKDVIRLFFATLFLVNFWINPFLYSWRLTRYRKTFVEIFETFGLRH